MTNVAKNGSWALTMIVALACDGGAVSVPDGSVPVDGNVVHDGGPPGAEDAAIADGGSGSDGGRSDGGGGGPDGGGSDGGGITGPWSPPIGIPMPPFGVHEGVDTSCGELTERPFTDLASLASLPAGSIVEIPAGVHTASRPIVIGGTGTPCQPIIVRGASAAARPTLRAAVGIRGSYVIVENIDFDLSTSESHMLGISMSDHVSLRHSEIHGLPIRRNSTVLWTGDSTHVVLWDNHIHDNGDFSVAGEIDVHGVGAARSWDLWIVDNHIHHNRGDGMQFGHQADNTLGRIYVGRNDIHDNGENSVDIKEASNVVISQNRLHDEPLGPVVLHDCPIDAAVIDNEIYGSSYGVSMASLEAACDDDVPVSLFVLRNRIHDAPGNGVEGWGAGKRYFVAGNSFERVGTPISVSPLASGSRVSNDDAALEDGLAAFEAVYGIDIH